MGYAYLAPALVVLLGFHFLPMFYAFYISLFNWRVRQGAFVGLGNYEAALTNAEFWEALKVTCFYAAGVVPAELILSVAIGVALHQRLRGRSLYRLIYFLPYVTPVVAAALVWRWILHSQYGILNYLLGLVGIPPQGWLLEPSGLVELLAQPLGLGVPAWAAGPSQALASIVLFTVWQAVGFGAVIVLAGVSNIPGEMYDAAQIDGASAWQRFRYITLPLLSPILFFLGIVATIGAFQSFSSIYVMTDPNPGGPLGTTRNAAVYIFQNFFEFTRLGYAAAVAFLLFAVVLGLTLLQIRVLGRRVHYQ